MITAYGYSIIGKYHVTKGSVCQDSFRIVTLSNGVVIAGAADGVGSAANAEEGSALAVKSAVDFCASCYPMDGSELSLKALLTTAFNYAFRQVYAKSCEENKPIENYDTTLTVVIYDGVHAVWGHSGDGAVLGLARDGKYHELTKVQKGDDGASVIPLRGLSRYWVFGSCEQELSSVLIVTDGMRDILCPRLLCTLYSEDNGDSRRVYTPLTAFLADPAGFTGDQQEDERRQEKIEHFLTANGDYNAAEFYDRLSYIYEKHFTGRAGSVVHEIRKGCVPVSLMQVVQDDKTVVALVNTDARTIAYDIRDYREPDWVALTKQYKRLEAEREAGTEPERLREETQETTQERHFHLPFLRRKG